MRTFNLNTNKINGNRKQTKSKCKEREKLCILTLVDIKIYYVNIYFIIVITLHSYVMYLPIYYVITTSIHTKVI